MKTSLANSWTLFFSQEMSIKSWVNLIGNTYPKLMEEFQFEEPFKPFP